MNKNMIKVACLFVSGFAGLYGMTQQEHDNKITSAQNIEQGYQIIRGDVNLPDFKFPVYVGFSDYPAKIKCKNILDEQGNPLRLKPNDVLVECWTASQESIHWPSESPSGIQYKTFPPKLPLSLLEGKKDGDVISFLFKTEEKIVRIELTCCTLDSDKKNFQAMLQKHKKTFTASPQYFKEDEQRLIDAGIIERYITASGKEAFCNGPRGFKFPQEIDVRINKDLWDAINSKNLLAIEK